MNIFWVLVFLNGCCGVFLIFDNGCGVFKKVSIKQFGMNIFLACDFLKSKNQKKYLLATLAIGHKFNPFIMA